MKDDRSSALRFALVASSVLLAGLAQYFISDGDLRWAITPLVVAVGCLMLATGGSQAPASSKSSPSPQPSPIKGEDEFVPQPSPKSSPIKGEDEFVSQSSPQSSPIKGEDETVPQPSALWKRFVWLDETTLGVAAFALAAILMSVSLLDFGRSGGDDLTLAWWSFGLAVALLLAAIPAIDGRWTALADRLKRSGGVHVSLRDMAVWIALAAILALSAALRLYNLEDIPAGLWFDEADNLIHARHYALDPGRTPAYAESTNLPTMFLLPIAALVKLTGVEVTTPRLIAAAFGVAGVGMTFLFVRHVMGTRCGLIAAFLVGVMRWDIIWSRIGMHGVTGVLFAALTGWLTLRAVRSGRASDYGLAGASLGLGMWFYTSFRLFPIVIALILLHHLIVNRPAVRSFVLKVALMALVSVFVASPVILLASSDPNGFFDRTKVTSVFTYSPREEWADNLTSNLVKHILMFGREGDPNPRHNLPHAPMLDYITGALFVLGFFFALTRWRSGAVFLLPFWVFLMTLPGVLTLPWEAPQSLRSILVIPAVAALSAYVLERLWSSGRAAPWRSVRRFTTPVILALLALVFYMNVDFYFDEQANDPRVFAAFSTDETLIARSQIERQRLGHSLWVSRQFVFSRIGDLLADHPKLHVISAPETLPLDSTKVWMGASAYFEPREKGFWEVMRAYYPDGEYQEVTPPNGGEPMFYTGFVSREQLAERQGLDATYFVDGTPVVGGRSTVSESVWHADAGPGEYPHETRLEGALLSLPGGEYELVSEGSIETVVEIDGQRVLDGDRTRRKIVLAEGLHSLSISATIEKEGDFIRVLWKPPDGEIEPIPLSRLFRGTVRPIGLAGRFYEGMEVGDVPDAMQTTPTMDLFHYVPVVPEPYVAVWEGSIDVEQTGTHRFRVSGSGQVKLFLDDYQIAQWPPGSGLESEASPFIRSGEHAIRVEYSTESPPSELEVLWAPPDAPLQPIPVEMLTPSPEWMLRLVK